MGEEFAKNDVNLKMMPFNMPFNKYSPMFYSFKLCRRQGKQTLESILLQKIQNFSNYRLKMMPILEVITLCRRRCRHQDATDGSRLPPQNTSFLQLLNFLAQPSSAFTSRFGTDKAVRGALEPPPEGGAGTKRFDRENPVSRIPYWGRIEKNSSPKSLYPKKKKTFYII